MTDTYRWTLDEYVLRCEDGASLAEIIAESGLDRDVLSDAVARWHLDHVKIIDAESVAITDAERGAAGFGSGVKAGLLTVAYRLEQCALEAEIQATIAVVVDRDYDHEEHPISRFLYVTDGHSMESYTLNEVAIGRFLRVGLGRPLEPKCSGEEVQASPHRVAGRDVLDRLLPAAIGIAALRIALKSLHPPVAPFDRWTRYLHVTDQGFLTLESTQLLTEVLRRKGRSADLSRIEQLQQSECLRVRKDPVMLVRGHDFIAALHKILQSPWGRRVAGGNLRTWSEDRLTRNLFMGLPTPMLDNSLLFTRLRLAFSDTA